MTCEGYSNYATFGVAVTLDNDRAASGIFRAKAVEKAALAPQHDAVIDGIWTVEQATKFTLVDWLRDFCERLVEDVSVSHQRSSELNELATLMASQMVQAGLTEVNWEELVDAQLAEMRLQGELQ